MWASRWMCLSRRRQLEPTPWAPGWPNAREPVPTAALSTAAPIPTAPPEVLVGLPADLLRRRPDVRRAERQLATATARIGVATADLYPKLSLTGSLGLASVTLTALFNLFTPAS